MRRLAVVVAGLAAFAWCSAATADPLTIRLRLVPANIHVQKELGLAKADVDVPAFADLRLVEEAARPLH